MAEEEAKDVRAPTSSHIEFRDRVRKTLYYGQYSDGSLPSLAVTDVAVEVLSSVVPSKRKCLDTNYAMVVSRRAKISPCTLMMGILYSERLRQGNPDYLKRVSSSDLFLISVMVASKYLYDEGEEEEVFNDDWAKAGSKTVGDVNKMEMEFLASIDWNLYISNEEFLGFVNKVESRVATSLGLCRGWFTYGDLSTLLDNARFLDTLGFFRHEVFKVICACAMAYLFSLSLALSVTTIANRHYHRHTHAQGYISTPVASTPPAPCLTTEAACRFHRPAVIQVASPELQVTVSLTGKERTWTGNGSRRREATKAGESGSGSRAKKEITNKMHFGAGHSSKNVNAACVERVSFDCRTFSNRLSSNPRNQTERIELVTRGLDISKRSSRLFSIALLKRLLVQQPCRNTPFANSVSLIRAKSNRFFSNSFPARENHDSPLYSTNVNGSLICVS